MTFTLQWATGNMDVLDLATARRRRLGPVHAQRLRLVQLSR